MYPSLMPALDLFPHFLWKNEQLKPAAVAAAAGGIEWHVAQMCVLMIHPGLAPERQLDASNLIPIPQDTFVWSSSRAFGSR